MQIQKLRLQHGWSQEQLADLSGLSVRTIQRIENGQTASVESLKSLGAVFNVDFSELTSEKDSEMNTLTANTDKAAEALAFAYVRKLKGFYIHAAQYAIIITGLAMINLITSPQYLWFLWPAFGWGIGLAFHGMRVFSRIPFLNADWEKREVEKYMGRKL